MYLSLAEELLIEIPSCLYPHIIGKNGEKIRKVQKDTGTHISIPKHGKEGHIGETFYQIYILKSKPP